MTDTPPSPVIPWRHHLALAVLLGGALLMAARAADLTMNHREFLQQEGDARMLRVVEIPATRGTLRDRHGALLAVSTPVKSVWARPAELAAARDRWPELGRELGVGVEHIRDRVAGARGREFVYLRRHVEPDVATRVAALGVPGVAMEREYRRFYPAGEVAAHVVGFTDVDGVGREGMELALDERLQGRVGSKRVIRDRLGRTVENVESVRAPVPGEDVRLSIDLRIQYLAYRALKAAKQRYRAQGGSVVVLDVASGEVLAMVNQPFYNPNKGSDRVGARVRNRAVTDLFEPGSTIKPFTVLAGLASGEFEPRSTVDTSPGLLRVGRHTVRDHRDYGVIDLETLMAKSSNVGASRIALTVAPETLWRVFDGLGFGLATGSGFPGEANGILTDYMRWGDIHRVTLSYGYGLSVSALQLARAYAVLGADGMLPPVTFERVDGDTPGRRVADARYVRQVRAMMESVLDEGGTGGRGRVPGYRVAGKTGTVKKSVAGGYAEDRYMALFAGMAPASLPRIVVLAVMDEPRSEDYYGGQVAAPLFAEVMGGALRTLGVAPDDLAPTSRQVIAHLEPPRHGAR
ncbi:MAG: penicillin-binding transpeptidase domain-containing protein [Gammaproteobacteria bacterium]|nr:penicillin-binding transpeptidase domain-containing protein [Gammaproteobacteria bacterium]